MTGSRWERWAPWIVIGAGAILRAAWAAHLSIAGAAGAEAYQIAVAFAQKGAIADAFLPGSGPTAHLSPVMPAVAGFVYRALGVRSFAAEMTLAGLSTGFCLGSFLLLFHAFGRLGTPFGARLAALAACCFLPIYQATEVGTFRIWEGALAAFLGAACLTAIVRTEQSRLGWTGARMMAMALLAAATLFVIPIFGLAAFAGAGISLLRRGQKRRLPAALLSSVVAVGIVLGPWVLRNQAQLGSPVLLRDNLGLETALAFHDGALNPVDPERAYMARFASIHPLGKPPLIARMRAEGGEVAYSKNLLVETKAWIAAHPGDAATLAARHAFEYLFPPYWVVGMGYNSAGPPVKQAIQAMSWLISGLMLAALGLAAVRRSTAFITSALFALSPIAFYAITQPMMRYRYLIFALSLFLAANFVAELVTIRRRGR